MAASSTAIANSALSKLGADRIISLDDDSRPARLLKEQYTKILEDLLRSHPWNFALVRTTLAVLTSTPDFEFDFEFQVPSDCLRLLETDLDDQDWRLEGSLLRANSDEVGVLYVTKAVYPGQYDANFSEVFACRLAHEACYALTQDPKLKEQLWKEYKEKLANARAFDAQEGGTRSVWARQWLNARN